MILSSFSFSASVFILLFLLWGKIDHLWCKHSFYNNIRIYGVNGYLLPSVKKWQQLTQKNFFFGFHFGDFSQVRNIYWFYFEIKGLHIVLYIVMPKLNLKLTVRHLSSPSPVNTDGWCLIFDQVVFHLFPVIWSFQLQV